jgi:hypothetical protein
LVSLEVGLKCIACFTLKNRFCVKALLNDRELPLPD